MCRIFTSSGRMNDEPTMTLRAKYSLGLSDIRSTIGRPHSISCEPFALAKRSKK